MERAKEVTSGNGRSIFSEYGDEISKACERAVREALIRHRKLGNDVVDLRNGEIVKLQGEEIDELLK